MEGLGGSYDNYVYTHLEILNIVVALKIWGQAWANKSIEIRCYNWTVVEVLSLGRARDNIMATCARNIWLLAGMYNINVIVTHIRGCDNCVADLLSRWYLTVDNYKKLQIFVECPTWVNVHLDLTLLNHDI